MSGNNKGNKVSIALCTYNGEKYIVEQLESIEHQDYENIEIIISDDGSTDNTISIIKEYSDKSKVPIKILTNTTGVSLGFKKNFEKAIMNSTGDFIALSDHDDIWMANKITTLVNNIGENLLIYCDSELVDSKGKSLNKLLSNNYNFVKGNDYKKLIFNNCVSGHAMMFKKELVKLSLPIPDVEYHDWWIAYAAMVYGSITYVNEPLVKFRLHDKNNSDTGNTVVNKPKTKFFWNKKGKTKNKWKAFENNKRDIKKLEVYKSLNFNDEYNDFFDEFIALIKKRENQVFSFGYAAFWAKNNSSFFYINNISFIKKWSFIIRKSIGMKPKKIFYQLNNKY